MSIDTAKDPRTALVETKYFSLHPKPLERWLWQQGLPQTAERVFWLHWEEGMRNRDWCSEIPIRRVARDCSIDPSTVTRAYQVLKAKGLIRRQDPGRDASKPFQQATAITEVRLPREFLTELGLSPNRPVRELQPTKSPVDQLKQGTPTAERPAATTPITTPIARRPTREETRALWCRASEAERTRFYLATRDRARQMDFDPCTRLTAADRAEISAQLVQTSAAMPVLSTPEPRAVPIKESLRRLSALDIARTRARLLSHSTADPTSELLRQVIWAVEEGTLRRFAPSLALNIALKKVREGVWTRPNRMPPNWLGLCRGSTVPETCGAA